MKQTFTFIPRGRYNAIRKRGHSMRRTGKQLTTTGMMSTFGGPGDSGVSPGEGLALMTKADLKNPKFEHLFELEQPVGTTGLARRLDAKQFFIAMRWDYNLHSREWYRNNPVTVSANGKSFKAIRTDWGPAQWTGRVADLSPGLAKKLGLKTDSIVTVTSPD